MSISRRKLVWAIAAVVAIPFALYVLAAGYFLLVPSAEDYAHRAEFESKAWRDRSLDQDPAWPTRLRMVDDLISRKRLDGLRRSDVESLLGPSDQTEK